MQELIQIVMPVFNERENIRGVLSDLRARVKTPFRVLIVYDFDEDNTLPAAKPLQGEFDLLFLKNRYGRGVLNAIKTGLEAAVDGGGAVLVSMADLSDDYSVVDEMFARVRAGDDLVCASRYIRGGKQLGGPWFKGFLSRLAGLSLHALTGIPTHDISNSSKMYTPQVLRSIRIESTGGFELGMEIVVKAFSMGFKISEIPAVWKDRSAGRSRFALWRWLPHYLRWYFFALRACRGRRMKNIVENG